ncbi:hypothetical protein A986_12039 [Pseudomonas fluorescens BRIP34879]|nr:hypothetical protein A986_12039 [Pseudomonas fluorescens BRIP34879]
MASRLVQRWAAHQNQALSRIRYTAFCWIGGASHPNAVQLSQRDVSVFDGAPQIKIKSAVT